VRTAEEGEGWTGGKLFGSAFEADLVVSLNRSSQPYKILFGTINPQLQETDLIAYVLGESFRFVRRGRLVGGLKGGREAWATTSSGRFERERIELIFVRVG